MSISYDYWQGESVHDVLPSLSAFRCQILAPNGTVTVSDDMTHLQHYLDADSIVIVANDAQMIVGYISLVSDWSIYHKRLLNTDAIEWDALVSQGPLVHEYYRGEGVAKGLISEVIDATQHREAHALVLDPGPLYDNRHAAAVHYLANQFGFSLLTSDPLDPPLFKRSIEFD